MPTFHVECCERCGRVIFFRTVCLQWRRKRCCGHPTRNKAADQTNVTTDIATVLEDIVHEDKNKAVESDVIADKVEGAVDEAVGHVMTDIQRARKL